MKFNVNYIKNLIKGDSGEPLPSELDWSNMKDGIFDKMNSLREVPAPSSQNESKRKFGVYWIVFAVFILSSIGAYHWMTSDHILSTAVIQDSGHQKANAKSRQGINTPQNEEQKDFIGTFNKNNRPESSVSEVSSIEKEIMSGLEKEQVIAKNHDQNERSMVEHFVAQREAVTGISVKEVPQIKNGFLIIKKIPLHLRLASFHTSSEFPLQPLWLETISDNTITQYQKSFPEFNHRSKPKSQSFMIEGGMSFWREGANMSDRKTYETPLTSFQLQGQYVRQLFENSFIMTGLQYQQLESRSEFLKTIENYPVTTENAVVLVIRNPISGETTPIREDITQNVSAEHHFRHYNRSKLLKLTSGFGRTWQFNACQSSVYFGGSINVITQNEGRSYFREEIIEYNGAQTRMYNNRFAADGLVGLRAGIPLNAKMAATAGFQVQRSLMNWSSRDDLNLYPTVINLQMGLSFLP